MARQTKQSIRKSGSSRKVAKAATSSVSELSLDTDDEIQMIREQQQPPSRSSYFAEGSEAGHSDQQQQQQSGSGGRGLGGIGAQPQRQSNNWLRDDSLRAQSLPPAPRPSSSSLSKAESTKKHQKQAAGGGSRHHHHQPRRG